MIGWEIKKGFKLKKINVLGLFLTLTLMMAACESDNSPKSKDDSNADSSKTEKSSDVLKKEDVISYLDEIKPQFASIVAVGTQFDVLRTSSANGEIDNFTFAESISNEIAPMNLKIVETVEAIKPPNELIELHEKIISMLNSQQPAFTEIVAAINNNDASKLTTANELLAEARKLDREVTNELKTIVEEHGVTMY